MLVSAKKSLFLLFFCLGASLPAQTSKRETAETILYGGGIYLADIVAFLAIRHVLVKGGGSLLGMKETWLLCAGFFTLGLLLAAVMNHLVDFQRYNRSYALLWLPMLVLNIVPFSVSSIRHGGSSWKLYSISALFGVLNSLHALFLGYKTESLLNHRMPIKHRRKLTAADKAFLEQKRKRTRTLKKTTEAVRDAIGIIPKKIKIQVG